MIGAFLKRIGKDGDAADGVHEEVHEETYFDVHDSADDAPQADSPRGGSFRAKFASKFAAGLRSKPRAQLTSIAGHRVFVPLIALWGAALGALCILALPASLILRISMGFGLAGLGSFAGILLALVAALLLGALAAIGAIAFQRSEQRFAAQTYAGDADEYDDQSGFEDADYGNEATLDDPWDEPIDPASELGSESFDAPIEVEPFSASEIEEDFADAWQDAEEPGEYENMGGDEFAQDTAAPAFDLAGFTDPNEQAPQASPEPEIEPATESRADKRPAPLVMAIAPAASAAEKLRQVPPEQLSLVEMVERFAVALHEHQEAERRVPGSQHTPNRDAALAEALKTLALFTEDGFNVSPDADPAHANALRDTTQELRAALMKLQNLRGAA